MLPDVKPKNRERTRESNSSATQIRDCPLCEFEGVDRHEIYTHLQTTHRKSALAAELLETTFAPE